MSKTLLHDPASVALYEKQLAAVRRIAYTMYFEIIVTFHQTERTTAALAKLTDQSLVFNDFQIIFEYNISIRMTSSYDSLMRRLRKAVLKEVNSICGLGQADITKISTRGDWDFWEHVTGLCEEDEADDSKVAVDGKFYF